MCHHSIIKETSCWQGLGADKQMWPILTTIRYLMQFSIEMIPFRNQQLLATFPSRGRLKLLTCQQELILVIYHSLSKRLYKSTTLNPISCIYGQKTPLCFAVILPSQSTNKPKKNSLYRSAQSHPDFLLPPTGVWHLKLFERCPLLIGFESRSDRI